MKIDQPKLAANFSPDGRYLDVNLFFRIAQVSGCRLVYASVNLYINFYYGNRY